MTPIEANGAREKNELKLIPLKRDNKLMRGLSFSFFSVLTLMALNLNYFTPKLRFALAIAISNSLKITAF